MRKWVDEQRALIRKDRHKAQNVALLASKKASKENDRGKKSANAIDENESMRVELEELRLAVKKMKADADEARKLREQVRKQEKTINALRNGKDDTAPSKTVEKPCIGSSRRVLGDCTSAKQNMQPSPNASVPKTHGNAGRDLPAKSIPLACSKSMKTQQQCARENEEVNTLTEEPTEHWLQRNLDALKKANDRLNEKFDHGERTKETHYLDDPVGPGQRKPYNAADYSGKVNVASHSSSGHSHAQHNLPQIATSSTPPSSDVTARAPVCPGEKKSQIFTYKNGTQKEVLPDGTTTISFANGDKKRTYAHEKKGIVVYYYAATKVSVFYLYVIFE